jgi:hypothetical protein
VKNEFAVLLVPTISHALKAERLLKKGGYSCKLIPVPRHLSSDCGVCVRVGIVDRDLAQGILEQGGMEASEWYDIP